MLETIAVLLIVLWLLGLVSPYTMGGFIHILLVIAIVVIPIRVLGRLSPVSRHAAQRCAGRAPRARSSRVAPSAAG